MAASFPGFPKAGLAFLADLKQNNTRDWFQPRKEIFESQVKAPMAALVEAFNSHLVKFAPDYDNHPAKAVYRIYRDTRFSKDKTPYKTHIAAILPRRGLQKHFHFRSLCGNVISSKASKHLSLQSRPTPAILSVGNCSAPRLPRWKIHDRRITCRTCFHRDYRRSETPSDAQSLFGPILPSWTCRRFCSNCDGTGHTSIKRYSV